MEDLDLAFNPEKYLFTIRRKKKKPVGGFKLTDFILQKYFRVEHECTVLFAAMENLIKTVYKEWKNMLNLRARQIEGKLRVHDEFVWDMKDLVTSLKKKFARKPYWKHLLEEVVKKNIQPQTEQ